MLVVGNDEIRGRPKYEKGSRIVRQADGKVFTVELADGESMMMAFIKEGDKAFMVGIAGRLLSGWELEEEEEK